MLTFLDKIPFGSPRLRRISFWLVVIFLAYIIIGFFVIPPITKNILLDQCQTVLKRPTTIGRVAFNPLTLNLKVDDLKVKKLKGDGQFVSVGSLSASPGISTIWRLAPVITHLHLRDLTVDITFFGDGQYSFTDLIGTSDKGQAKRKQIEDNATTEESGTVFPFALYGFEMTNATIVFDDRPREKKHIISNLNLFVPFTSSFLSLRKEFTQPKFTAVVNGDPVELKGRTLPFDDTLLTEFELGAVDIDLDQYWRYLPIESPLQLVKGRFTSNISLFFERPDAQRINLFLGGGGSLNDLELSAPGDGNVLALKELSFEMEKYSLGDNQLVLTSILMDQPYFKVIRRKDDAINWTDYFPGSEITQEGAMIQTSDKDTGLLLDIRSIEVKNGTLAWHDKAVPGGYERTFPNFTFKGTEISSHGDRPSQFELSIGKKAGIALKGIATMQPFASTSTITVAGLQLPNYKPYFDQVLPINVDSGELGFSAEIDIKMTDDTPALLVNNGAATISNLALRKPDAKEPSLGLTKLAMSGTTVDLKGKTIEVGEINLKTPFFKVEKEKSGQLDLVRLFMNTKKDPEPKALKPTEELARVAGEKDWTATVKTVRMTEGVASFKDISLKHPATLSFEHLAAEVNNITTKNDETMTYAVSTRLGDHGNIELSGKATTAPLKGNGNLRIKGINLRPFDGHLGEHAELLFASGTASTDLKYVFSGGDTPRFTITGNAALSRVKLKDTQGHGEFAGIDAFKLVGIHFANEPYRLSIANIHLDAPSVVIDFDEKGHLNLRRAFGIPEPPPVSTEGKAAAKKATKAKKKTKKVISHKKQETFFNTIDIGIITMDKGRISFRDASVHPVYYTIISDMRLGLIDISQSSKARPKFDFTAKIGSAPMSITGAFNPAITPMYSNLAITVSGMELAPLSPYTIEYMAYPIEKGRLYADVTVKTDNWELKADNKFFVEQLKLGPKDKRPNAPKVPVKFGLAMLQDSNGDLELDLPIRGRLDDPDFHIGGIVFKTIASLFVKALASPFTLIGSIFGGGAEDMDFVVFEPGRHSLDAGGLQKMETTIKALNERKRLKLEIDGVIDPVADKKGLVAVIFEDKLKQQKFNSLSRKERSATTVNAMEILPEEYEELLFQAYKAEPDDEGIKPTTLFVTNRQPIEFMEKFILDRIIITEQHLNDLAMRRATSVKDHIIKREATLTERVFPINRRKDKTGKIGVPKHRADLDIK